MFSVNTQLYIPVMRWSSPVNFNFNTQQYILITWWHSILAKIYLDQAYWEFCSCMKQSFIVQRDRTYISAKGSCRWYQCIFLEFFSLCKLTDQFYGSSRKRLFMNMTCLLVHNSDWEYIIYCGKIKHSLQSLLRKTSLFHGSSNPIISIEENRKFFSRNLLHVT